MYSKNNVESISFDITSILLDIRAFWVSILMCGLATAILVGCWFSGAENKDYSSTTVFSITSNTGNVLSNVDKANTVLSTMADILQSKELNRIVVKEIGDFNYYTSTEYIEDTNMISLTVTSSTPSVSFYVLNSIYDNFLVILSEIMADVRLVTIQKAFVPMLPNASYNLYVYITIAFLFGCCACGGFITWLSILRDTVKNGEDMRNKVDARLLGTIPYLADKLGLSDKSSVPLMTISHKNYWYQESFHLVGGRLSQYAEKHAMKSIIFTSVFPNEGKTTCLLNTAISLSMNNKKVLIIDGDFRNPTVAQALHIVPEFDKCLSNVLSGNQVDWEKIWKLPEHNVYALTNAKPHNNSVITLSDGRFEKLLNEAGQLFDVILVDSGPTAFVSDIELLKMRCDGIVMVVSQDNAPVGMINSTIDMLDTEGKMIGCVYKETRKVRKRKPYGYNYYWKEPAIKKDR